MLTAGSVPRRFNMLIPFAAAAAVIVAVGASVALPHLLTGSSPGSGSSSGSGSGSGSGAAGASPTSGNGTPAFGRYPPFQVVLTSNEKPREFKSVVMVESAATGRVLEILAQPSQGYRWLDVSATQDAAKFVVAAGPSSAPYAPTRLYTLDLTASGKVADLTPLPGSPLPGALDEIAASANGSTVAYVTSAPGASSFAVGVLSGGKARQWTIPGNKVSGVPSIAVSGDGSMLAFSTDGRPKRGAESAVWVLPAASAPGSVTSVARKIRDYTWNGATYPMTLPASVLLSPDGSDLFVSTVTTSASGKFTTRVTAYSTANGSSFGTISTWDNANAQDLIPVGGLPLIWDPFPFQEAGKSDNTAYLLNPAARTRTTVHLHGIPSGEYPQLAW